MRNKNSVLRGLLDWLIIIVIFLIGFWLIATQPLGFKLERLPGNLGDTRFNNYILEHDYRWITRDDPSLWDAPFFYPYQQTLAFSDNHLGSMIFYAFFRCLGLYRETAFQAWYLLSYLLNFAAATIVMKKINLKPLAIGIGAFLFTFSLPVLAREGHGQLSYRFCIPLACYSFWLFSQKPKLKLLALTLLWLVWQFYLSIYLGYFLSLLLTVIAIGLPFYQYRSIIKCLRYWPCLIINAWKSIKVKPDIFYLFSIFSLFLALIYLFQPYISASKTYNLTRSWQEVSQILPRPQSYFISDGSILWGSFSNHVANIENYRWEHQLFVGISAFTLLTLGTIWRFQSPYRKMAFLFLNAAAILVLLTIKIDSFSIYKIIWTLPGVNSIRAVSRIILVLLWPIALFISIELDALLRLNNQVFNYSIIGIIFLSLMIIESALFNHVTFSKAEAYSRILTLREQIPSNLPEDPVLFVWNPNSSKWYFTELDAMMLSQDLGWPVLNGYSGNTIKGYGQTKGCDQAISRIISFMDHQNITDTSYYYNFISRIVSIGPINCKWIKNLRMPHPSYSQSSGAFSKDIYSGIIIKIVSLTKKKNFLIIHIDVENHSSILLPAGSLSGNPFQLSWRMIDTNQKDPYQGFDSRKDLISDIPPGDHALMTIITSPPTEKGEYSVEISAVQENIAWFHDRGMSISKSTQKIIVTDESKWTISN